MNKNTAYNMSYLTALIALVACAIIGCVTQQSKAPPAPKRVPPPRDSAAVAGMVPPPPAPLSVELLARKQLPPPHPMVVQEPGYTNSASGLGFSLKGTNVTVSWLNSNQYLIYSTNAALPLNRWTLPLQTNIRQTNGGRYVLTLPAQDYMFFSLVSAPSNSIMLGWNYVLALSPNVYRFVLYSGSSPGVYTTRVPQTGLGFFGSVPTPNKTNYYAVTAQNSVGIESAFSAEWVYVKP